MNLIEQLEKLPRTHMYNHERQDGSDEAVCTYVKLSDVRASIEEHKREAVEPVAYTDSDNNYLEWTIEALCEKAVCSKNDSIPLYTAPQPDHTKLIGELVEALESFDIFDDFSELYHLKKNVDLDALLTKAREAIK